MLSLLFSSLLCSLFAIHHAPPDFFLDKFETSMMGDFSAHFHRPELGIHTVEGNVAGSRAAALTKKRQRQQEEFAEKERQIRSKTSQALQKTDQKFQQHSSL